MHRHAKFHHNQSNCCGDIAFNVIKMAAVHHFRFVGQILGRPTTRICGLYHYAKFGCNHISRFDYTTVWPEHVYLLPFLAVLGVKIGEN